MQFNSYSYLLCLSVVVVVFWLLPVRARRSYVLAVSVAFYASWNAYFIVVPAFVGAVAYLSAERVTRRPDASRTALVTGIVLILLCLAYVKYLGFITINLNAVALRWHLPAMAFARIALPLGISFYSFEAISYLLDARQRRVGAVGLMDLALFIMFWPHLIAGPIVRIRELVPQLRFDRTFDVSLAVSGMDRLLWGLVQKNVFANSLAAWVDDGFLPRAALLNSTIDNWALALAFGLQIYFDFAAYSNMAIGAAALIGVRLPDNFRFPYHAATPPDFWARWHMTLSRWIRDYLFFPLSARYSGSTVKLYASLVGVMALVGLWHGAAWGFMAWGVMHGLYLVAYRAYESWRDRRHPALAGSKRMAFVWRVLTLAAVAAAWVPFRAGSLAQAGTMLARMTVRWSFGLSYSMNFYLVTILLCVWCLIEPYCARGVAYAESLAERAPAYFVANWFVLRPLVYATALLLFMIFDDRDIQFIYFQF